MKTDILYAKKSDQLLKKEKVFNAVNAKVKQFDFLKALQEKSKTSAYMLKEKTAVRAEEKKKIQENTSQDVRAKSLTKAGVNHSYKGKNRAIVVVVAVVTAEVSAVAAAVAVAIATAAVAVVAAKDTASVNVVTATVTVVVVAKDTAIVVSTAIDVVVTAAVTIATAAAAAAPAVAKVTIKGTTNNDTHLLPLTNLPLKSPPVCPTSEIHLRTGGAL